MPMKTGTGQFGVPYGTKEYGRLSSAKCRRDNPVAYLLRQARYRSKKKGVEFTVTPADVKIPEFCPVFGTKLIPSAGPRTMDTYSIDRKDNTKGYTPENTRVISWRANQMKGDLSIEDVRNLLRYMEGD